MFPLTSRHTFLIAAATLLASSASAAVVSVNFGTTLNGATETAGAIAVSSPNWNNAAGASGTLSGLIDSTGANTGASVTWSSPNTWSSAATDVAGNDNGILTKGYLDDSATTGPSVSLSPYFLSNVYVILASDTNNSAAANITLGGYKVNGVSYGWNGTATVAGVASWATANSWSNSATLVEGKNYLKIANVAGAVNVTSTRPSGGRAGIAGVQVENAYAGTILYWDINDSTAGAGGATPAGVWDSSSSKWSSDATGASAAGAWNGNNVAAFSAGGDATGAYTVTVSGTQTARGIWFQEGNVTLSGGTISLTNERTIVASTGLQTLASTLGADGDITLSVGGVSGIRLTGDITGGVNTLVSGSGVVELSGTRSGTTGNITVSGATLAVGDDASFGAVPGAPVAAAITLSGGTLTNATGYDGAGAFASSASFAINANRGVTLGASGGTFKVATGSTLTVNGVVTGGGTLSKSGTGTLVLAATNTYTGGTTVNAGTLEVSGRIGTGAIAVANGATLAFSATGAYTIGALTLRGNLTKSGSGSLTTSGLVFNSNSGAQSFNMSGGTLTLNGSLTTGDVNGAAQDMAFTMTGGDFIVTNTGGNQFSMSNWGGTTTANISGGTMTVDAYWGPAIGQRGITNFTVGGTAAVTFKHANGITLGGQSSPMGTGNVYLNGGTLTVAKVAKGAGIGNFYFNGGTLKAYAANASFMENLTAAKVQSNGAVIDSNGFNITIAQALLADIGSTGGLTKNGAGTLTLSGVNTYAGATTINTGTLAVSGTIRINGSSGITIASGAALTLSGTLVATDGADKIVNNGGTFTAGGVLDLNGAFDGFNSGASGLYSLITGTGGTNSGAFTAVNGYNTSVWSDVTYSGGVLTFTAVPEPSTYGLLGAGALAAMAFVKRRRRK